MLALKANQGTLMEDQEYFSDREFLEKSEYKKTLEKARGKTEKREYWKTDDIAWLSQKKEWSGLKSIILTRNIVTEADGRKAFYK